MITGRKPLHPCPLVIAAIMAAALILSHGVNAEEPGSTWEYSNFDVRSVADGIVQDQPTTNSISTGNHRTAKNRVFKRLSRSRHEPKFIRFAKECAEIEAIPFVEISTSDTKRVFFGVNFDGVIGFHGLLL